MPVTAVTAEDTCADCSLRRPKGVFISEPGGCNGDLSTLAYVAVMIADSMVVAYIIVRLCI